MLPHWQLIIYFARTLGIILLQIEVVIILNSMFCLSNPGTIFHQQVQRAENNYKVTEWTGEIDLQHCVCMCPCQYTCSGQCKGVFALPDTDTDAIMFPAARYISPTAHHRDSTHKEDQKIHSSKHVGLYQ